MRWTRVNKDYTIYDTRLKVTNLLEGSEYQFRVSAVNAAGNSEPSDSSPYVLCKEPSCKFYLFVYTCSHSCKTFLQDLKREQLLVIPENVKENLCIEKYNYTVLVDLL